MSSSTHPNPNPEPDDDQRLFNAIVGDLDGAALERAATTTPQPMPSATPNTPAAPEVPAAADAAVSDGAGSRRTVWDAVTSWIDRRGTQPADEHGHITTGAFTGVAIMTALVAALAFALSFTMMFAAAQHYGWPRQLAALFPVLIDVGAVSGTFMGAISGHRVYRRIGHQVLAITLSASVVFNLAGHSVMGGVLAPGLPPLPSGWAWTGTAAAILVPALLAYLVHAFSVALKTFTDQRRAQRAAEQAERARKAEVERKRVERAARQDAVGQQPPRTPAAPAPPEASGAPQRRAELDRETALGVIRQHLSADATPAVARELFAGQGFTVEVHDRTLRRWIKDAHESTH